VPCSAQSWACGTTIVYRAGRFAARRARGGQVDRPPLVRFRCSCPFGVRWPRRSVSEATDLRTIPLRRWFERPRRRRPRRHRDVRTRPCGFWRLASPADCVRWSWRRRPRGSFVAAFPSAHVPGSLVGLLSRPGRVRFKTRRRPWDSLSRPSQCCSDPRLTGVSSMPIGPTCRFAAAPSASVFLARSDRYVGPPGAVGCGSWGSIRGSAVPRVPPVPPRLLRTGPDAPRWPGLPWASRSSLGCSSRGPCAFTSGGANARGLRRFVAVRLQIGSRRSRLPFGASEGAGD